MNKRSAWIIGGLCIGLILSVSIVLVPELSSAQLQDVLPSTNQVFQGSPGLLQRFSDIRTILATIFNFLIIIAGTIFIILLLIGGVQYLTSAGNEEGTGKAKKLMIDAIIGLILTLSAWAIGTFILTRLGFTGAGSGAVFQRLPPQNITTLSEFNIYDQQCTAAGGVGATPPFRGVGTYSCN